MWQSQMGDRLAKERREWAGGTAQRQIHDRPWFPRKPRNLYGWKFFITIQQQRRIAGDENWITPLWRDKHHPTQMGPALADPAWPLPNRVQKSYRTNFLGTGSAFVRHLFRHYRFPNPNEKIHTVTFFHSPNNPIKATWLKSLPAPTNTRRQRSTFPISN